MSDRGIVLEVSDPCARRLTLYLDKGEVGLPSLTNGVSVGAAARLWRGSDGG